MVLLAGPCLDETFGVVVINAENDQAARTFMLNDPSVQEQRHDGRAASDESILDEGRFS